MKPEAQTSTCYCVIPHPTEDSILLREVQDGYECPHLPLPWAKSDYFPDHIPLIIETILGSIGIDVIVLRHLAGLRDVQACLLEVQSMPETTPAPYVWLDRSDSMNAAWVVDESQREWIALSNAPSRDMPGSPWQRPGWFQDTCRWMKERLDDCGYELVTGVQQIKGAWEWSSILRAGTDHGAVFLKADYLKPPREAEVIRKLSAEWKQYLPTVLAIDIERNWLLTQDFGSTTLDVLGVDDHSRALALGAKIQRSTAKDIAEWLALGCPDMTPASLFASLCHLIEEAAVLRAGPHGLNSAEMSDLRRALPEIEDMCGRLSASCLPATLCNEDFRPANIAVHNGSFIYFDWSNSAVSHPFFSLIYFFSRMKIDGAKVGWNSQVGQILSDSYLGEWADYGSVESLREDLNLSRRLYPLYDMIRCHGDLPFIDPESPWGSNTVKYIPMTARNLINSLSPGS